MKTHLGIDIGSSQIKMVEVAISANALRIERAYIAPVSPKLLLSSLPADSEELSHLLKIMLKESGIKERKAHISISETQVYTRVIEMPLLTDKELVQALRWEAERYVPLPLDEIHMDHAIVAQYPAKKQMDVLIVASSRAIISRYMHIFEMAGVSVESFENEALPLIRAFSDPNSNYVILDIGDTITSIIVVRKGLIVLVRTIAIGGNTFTRSLVTELNIPFAQAEEYKKTYGLTPGQHSDAVLKAFTPLVDTIVSEVSQGILYSKEKYPEDIINTVVLTGGGSLLGGLGPLFSTKLQTNVAIGNSWKNASVSPVSTRFSSVVPMFSVATGLALYEKD